MNKELTPLEAFIELRNGLINNDIKNGFLEELIVIEKSLNALEIVKKKIMSLVSLDNWEICKGHYRVYDSELYLYNELTQEEYDLLKEVLL